MDDFNDNPYEIFGLVPGAPKRQVRSAYRRLARRFHPDLNPGDPKAEEKFRQVQWASEVVTTATAKKITSAGVDGVIRPTHSSTRRTDPFSSFFSALRNFYATKRRS